MKGLSEIVVVTGIIVLSGLLSFPFIFIFKSLGLNFFYDIAFGLAKMCMPIAYLCLLFCLIMKSIEWYLFTEEENDE